MRIGVITFPGSNCDQDILRTLKEQFQAEAEMLWHRDSIAGGFDLLVVPGGFSYGDYLRAGAIARFAPAMNSLLDHVRRGGPALGICNGFQILCEAGLLPGALIRNAGLKHICKNVTIRANTNNRFLSALPAGREYSIPISHSDGNYRIEPDELARIQDQNQIAFTYNGNPNGSVADIAGVTDREHRVLGMMPHPERAVNPLLGGVDGRPLLECILAHCRTAVG
ncbi:MAG: phosphoribosylformylglycinamidine synthase subunit PurQ [Spirochaetales bacterium]|nr:phosphoribosylformylglycinamidine synthase subunit PurQ [Leptospiraceae bacterium]MCP5480812.1 phosphoribosylformylglycinamidine synthase subunit PurQ [Spirochaetales bacterium]